MIHPQANAFIQTCVGSGFTIRQISGDASFRTYYRVVLPDHKTMVFMDAPPDKEDSEPFVKIATFLGNHGVGVPKVFHADLKGGFLLLEDFGDVTLLEALNQGQNPRMLYTLAVENLLQLQATPKDGQCLAHGRPYDRVLLDREFALLTDWTIPKILQRTITDSQRKTFQSCFDLIIDQVLRQPVVLVHRDYHSRNLMWTGDRLGIIDFQDAVMGPITYDLASLLRDCYVAWDRPFREEITQIWLQGAGDLLGYAPDEKTFVRDFDFMAIQRNLKAVGIFGRLSHRDGKHGYLKDIPRTMGYVRETLAAYPELTPLADLLIHFGAMEP